MKVLPLSYKPLLDLCVARMTTQKGVKWCTFALNALKLNYKTAVFLASGEVFVFTWAYAKNAGRMTSEILL